MTLGEKTWGVTNLQAKAEIDAGAIRITRLRAKMDGAIKLQCATR
jgi:hypothetical protein